MRLMELIILNLRYRSDEDDINLDLEYMILNLDLFDFKNGKVRGDEDDGKIYWY